MADCFWSNLRLTDDGLTAADRCSGCGHCAAICPSAAIGLDGLPREDVEPAEADGEIPAVQLLHAMKLRRSTRWFTDQVPGRETLTYLLQAGRFSPTGGNCQGNRFVVVQEQLPALRELAWQGLWSAANAPEAEKGRDYREVWKRMHAAYRRTGQDALLFNAPVLLVIAAQNVTDGSLAAANIELLAQSLGLGCLHSGFLKSALSDSEEAQALLGLSDRRVTNCMLIGYPARSYRRTAPRLPLQVTWR